MYERFMCKCTTCVQSQWRPEKGVRSPGTGVTVVRHHIRPGNQTQILRKEQPVLPTTVKLYSPNLLTVFTIKTISSFAFLVPKPHFQDFVLFLVFLIQGFSV